MIERIHKYITLVFQYVPTSFLVGLLVVLCVGTILSLVLVGGKKGIKWSARVLLVEYMVLLLALAVFTRKLHPGRPFNFSLFWSYLAIMDGSSDILIQNIANVCAFVPVGLLLGCTFDQMKWWKALLIGGGLSILIEVLQFVFKRGFTEFDDVFHNVLGCLIGYGVYVLVTRAVRKICQG